MVAVSATCELPRSRRVDFLALYSSGDAAAAQSRKSGPGWPQGRMQPGYSSMIDEGQKIQLLCRPRCLRLSEAQVVAQAIDKQ